jgi:hypothetical protein
MIVGVTIENGAYGPRAVLTSEWSVAVERYLKAAAVTEIELNHAKGWHGDTVAFLLTKILGATSVKSNSNSQLS